jgi:alkanesulfonate monooxygenase SsuD/methylene tetrahydromethanopterin reductase-like flavin-dependent oxidoreductase (luciferase family)
MADFPPLSIAVFGNTADRIMRNIQELDTIGYPRVWVGENRADPYALAAAAAVVTKQAIIGTSVAIWSRSPVSAVLSCTTIEHLAGGRFVHGVGSGPAERNVNWHNIPYRRFGSRMREYLIALRLAWESSKEHPAYFDGEFFKINGYVRASRPIQAHLPTYVGVARPASTEIAGELADGILLDTNLSPGYIAEIILPALERGANKAGRPVRDYLVTLGMLVAIDKDRAQAIDWARQRIVSHIVHDYYFNMYKLGGFEKEALTSIDAVKRGDTRGALDAISEEMVLTYACAGTVDEVHRQIQKWVPYVNDIRLSVPLGALPDDEIEANWRQVIDAFPPAWQPVA